jgi:hypothetical protein
LIFALQANPSAAPIQQHQRLFLCMIQAPKPEPEIMRYELTEGEWAVIKQLLPAALASLFR